MEKISKSSYLTYLDCKRKYYYSLVGYIQETNEMMMYGLDFHKVLEDYNKKLMTGEDYKCPKKFESNFEAYNIMRGMLEEKGYQKVPVASELKLMSGDIYGIIDCVFYNPNGKYMVIDYKTVMKVGKFDSEKYKPEMMLYAFIYAANKNIELKSISTGIMRFEQNGTGFDFNEIPVDEDYINELITDIGRMDDFIKNSSGDISEFPMVDETKSSFSCRYCNYNKVCK